jgi:hypothetical protein
MSFFTRFPKISYDVKGNGNLKLVTDILRRVKIKSAIRDNASLFDKFDVQNGDTPETVAYKVYGDAKYHWVIMLMNDITDRYYDWPLNDQDFETYVNEKYDNPGAIHHYEITQTSGSQEGNGPDDYEHKIEVNSTEPGAQSVSNYEYERRLQDQKRQIKLLDPSYLPEFENEFNKLIQLR